MVCHGCPLPNPPHETDLHLGDAHHPRGRDPTDWHCANRSFRGTAVVSAVLQGCDAGIRHDHPGCRLVPVGCHHNLFGVVFLASSALVLRASGSWGGVLARHPVGGLLLAAQVEVEATFCANLGVANVMCDPGSQPACFDGKPLMDHPPQVLQPWGHSLPLQCPEWSPQVPQPPEHFRRLELPQQLDFDFAACQLLKVPPPPLFEARRVAVASQWTTPPQHHV